MLDAKIRALLSDREAQERVKRMAGMCKYGLPK